MIGTTIIPLLNFISFFATPIFVIKILEWFLPLHNKFWVKPLLYISSSLLSGMIIYIGDPVNLPGAVIPFGISVLLCCDGSYLQRISIVIILSTLGLSYNALIDSGIIITRYLYLNNFLRLLVWLFVYLTVRRFAPKQEYNLPVRLWLLLDLLTLTPFSALLISVLLGYPYEGITIQNALLLPVIMLTSFGLLWAIVVLARQQMLEQEKNLYHINEIYYHSLEQEQQQIRRLRHDMANHLQTMAVLDPLEMKGYLKQLMHTPALEYAVNHCDNTIVNAVISTKLITMEKYSITSDLSISIPKNLPLDSVDLCAVFSNSMDNAIEACQKLPVESRNIMLKSKAEKGIFVLRIQNPIGEMPYIQNDTFISTKKNKKEHGYGLASMKEIAGRYYGSIETSIHNGQFTLLLYLTLREPQ